MSDPQTPPSGYRRLTPFEVWRLARANVLLTVLILMVAAWQVWRLFQGDESLGIAWGGLSGLALAEGRWWTPLTSMFMHAGLAHLIFNLMALASLGPPVCLRFGRDRTGALLYLGFYLLCGALGDAMFLALHPLGAINMIGASGAIFGLWGAVARMRPDGTLAPIFSRQVWKQTQGAIISNLVIMAIVVGPALLSGQWNGGGIAWEAHLGGYLGGLLLIGLPIFRGRWPQARGDEAVEPGRQRV